jgi:hypothetical protein
MPHPPTHPQIYRATPIGPDGTEQGDSQDFLITPFSESLCAYKVKALLIGVIVGFLLSAFGVGLSKR